LKSSSVLWFLGLCALLTFSNIAMAAETPCVASAAVQTALEASSALAVDCGRSETCQGQRLAVLHSALEAHPEDYFLRKAVVDLLQPRGDAEPTPEFLTLRHQLLQQAKAHPDDAVALDLAARAAETDEETWDLFQQAVAADPTFPPPHRALAWILAFDRDDPTAARDNVQRYLDLCPVRLDRVFSLSRKIKDDAFWAARLETTRKALETADPSLVLDTYSAAWQVAFKVTPPAQFPKLREQVAADLERIKALEQTDRIAWLDLLKEGYDLTSETAGRERVEARLAELQPCAAQVLQTRFKSWEETHPHPNGETPKAESQSYYRTLLDFTAPLVEQCPNADLLWLHRTHSAAKLNPPATDVLRQGSDRLLAAAEAGRLSVGRPMELMIADLLLQARIDPERALELTVAGGPKLIEERKKRLEDDRLPEAMRERLERYSPVEDLEQQLRLARAQTRAGQLEASRRSLQAAEVQLTPLLTAWEDDEQLSNQIPRWRGRLLQERGDLAAAEDHPQDAALYLHRAAVLGGDEELAERAATLWRESGGSAAAWAALDDAAAPAEDTAAPGNWMTRDEALPAFALSDLQGKTWTLTQLQGKTVLANIWATWCGPCRLEHPYIQKLHERLKDRDDITVVTLNVDFSPGMITPYLEENGYTFPVLMAMDYVEEVVGSLAIPRNWLLQGDGTLLKEQLGFNPEETEEEWLASTMGLLEGLVAAGGAGR